MSIVFGLLRIFPFNFKLSQLYFATSASKRTLIRGSQVTYQIKLLLGAVFTKLAFPEREIGARKWLALLVLFGGIALASVPSESGKKDDAGSSAHPRTPREQSGMRGGRTIV